MHACKVWRVTCLIRVRQSICRSRSCSWSSRDRNPRRRSGDVETPDNGKPCFEYMRQTAINHVVREIERGEMRGERGGWREGGREGGRERKGDREGGGGKEGGREREIEKGGERVGGWREGGREGGRELVSE